MTEALNIPPDRVAVSFHIGLDRRGHLLILKFAFMDRRTEIIGLPSTVAMFLLESLRRPETVTRLQRQPAHPRAEKIFFDRQPELTQAELAGLSAAHVANGLRFDVFDGAVILSLDLPPDRHVLLGLPNAVADHLRKRLTEASPHMRDPSQAGGRPN